MAPDDPIFEKALARHLRSSSEPMPEQHQDCADAETLAAYHDRLLAPHELNAWKEHIAGCSRCQEILALLESTEEIPLATAGEQIGDSRVLAMPSQEVHSAQRSTTPTSISSPPPKMPARSPASSKPRRSPVANWRWVLPAGALAAGLLVWVVSREDHLQKSILQPSSPSASVAENHRTAPPVPQSSADTRSMKAQPEVQSNYGGPGRLTAPAGRAETRLGHRGAAPARANGAQLDELDRDQGLSSNLRKGAPLAGGIVSKDGAYAKNKVGPSNPALQQQAPRLAGQESRQDDLKQQDLNAFIATDKLSAEAAAGKNPSAPPPPPARPNVFDRESNLRKKEQAEEKSDAPVVSALNQTVVVSSEPNVVLSTSAAALLDTSGPRIFPVPGTKVIWKIDDDGRVRRTSDLGDSWQVQDAGVNATLLSGSAPSEKVCWLVGTFGTVVVTTDGGAHWTKRGLRVSSPVDRITAFDAQHAVVMLQSTNVRFETFDGGLTWTLVTKK